jgi:hypothetical protein
MAALIALFDRSSGSFVVAKGLVSDWRALVDVSDCLAWGERPVESVGDCSDRA